MQANSSFFDFDDDVRDETATSELHFGQFLRRIALQLHTCADMQDELAQVVSKMVNALGSLPDEDIVRLQAIDRAAQTLLDLAAVIDACSQIVAVKDEVVPAEYLSVLKLAELRRKLLA
jgi:uncharacterized protein YutE (UPF0331/DUF86 family)